MPPLSTKQTIISHFNSMNTKILLHVGDQDPGLVQANKCGGLRPVNGVPTVLFIARSATAIHI
jgi:hypothetical protein